MTYSVILQPEAAVQAFEIDAWWRENRPDSQDRFASELADAIDRLRQSPLPAARVRRRPPVYRVLLKVSCNHVYYRVDEQTRVVDIVAVWGGPRRGRPALPR